jgi:adenosylcobinamide-phosphate synthase
MAMRGHSGKPRPALALIAALIFDLTLGDPPNRLHPVAWMGSGIAAAKKHAPRRGALAQLIYGGFVTLGGGLSALGLGRVTEGLIDRLPGPLDWLMEGLLLKMTFSFHRLAHAAREIETALDKPDLTEARRLVSWHLVSRDTSKLTRSQVAAATIESVAESTSDGIMAPLLAYAVSGLSGAMVYRFVNTADSMLGYRDAAREWLGKIPARFDDLLNLIPARLTALLLMLGSALVGENACGAWWVWRRDSSKTASPNAGHPMSAMAGALEVELEKVDHYTLGSGQRAPGSDDIGRAVRVVEATTSLGAGLLVLTFIITRVRQREEGFTSDD